MTINKTKIDSVDNNAEATTLQDNAEATTLQDNVDCKIDDISLELCQYYDFWIGINAVYEKWSRAHGLTVNEVFLLYALLNEKECTQSLVCERLLLPKQTVNAVLNSFEKRGYVDKSVSTLDKRNKILCLTTEGKKFATTVLDKLDLLEMNALAKMTGRERRALIEGSNAYLKHLSDGLKVIAE